MLLTLALRYAEVGYNVIGIDIDNEKVESSIPGKAILNTFLMKEFTPPNLLDSKPQSF